MPTSGKTSEVLFFSRGKAFEQDQLKIKREAGTSSNRIQIKDHNLRPFSFPLLFLSVIQLGLIVYRYVFVGGNSLYILGDLVFLFGMSGFSILMLAHVGLLDPLRTRFTNYFDMNSVSIRTDD